MPKRPVSRKLNDRALRAALAARTERLHASASRAFPAASAGLSTAIRDLSLPAPTHAAGPPLPLVEPIWSFWLDAAHLARLTTVLAARQIEAHMPGSSRIPKLNLPPPLIGLLKPGLTITTMATAPPTVLPTTSRITASASPATAVVLA